MKNRWPCLLLLFAVVGHASSLYAESPVFDTVETLRKRGDFDGVQKYLDKIERDPSVPAKIKQRIPYERAITLIRSVRNVKGAKLQHKQLGRAAAYLEQFIKANPKHALVGNARTARGNIYLGKAEVNKNELQQPGNAARKSELRKESLENVRKARAEFTSALPVFKARLESFGVFVPPEQKERRQQQRLAESYYITTQLSLAKCSYTEAHAHGRKDPQFRALLAKAIKQFEAIHRRYRTLGYGLYARLWQGKCFEEQGKIGRALGIYGELLSHNGKSALLQHLQREALYFKIICLNHESKRDYQLVEMFAVEWWKRNQQHQTTPIGLGVKYELARARTMLGSTANDIPDQDKPKYLTLAKTDAEFVAKYSGNHQQPAKVFIVQIKRLLGE